MNSELDKKLALGRTIPHLILFFFILDAVFRFVPLEWLTFRAWEAVRRYPAPDAPFRRNVHYVNEKAYGDLANMGNLPGYRQYRKEVFSTDASGFRQNSPKEATSLPVKAILLGDSFGVGSGVNDDETLSADLERELHFGIYNAAGMDFSFSHIVNLTRRLDLKEGFVIFEFFEWRDLPDLNELGFRENFFAAKSPDQPGSFHKTRWTLRKWKEGFIQTSPLKIFITKLYKKLENGRFFPNPGLKQIQTRILKNGAPMIFFTEYIQNSELEKEVNPEGLVQFSNELSKRNLKLVMVLVPDKYTVYKSLIEGSITTPMPRELFIDKVEKALTARGLSVINLTESFQQKANEDIVAGQLIYLTDDTHWNARGIEAAAKEIARRWPFPVSY